MYYTEIYDCCFRAVKKSSFLLCICFGQVAYDAMEQVLCMCPGHRASLGVEILNSLPCSFVKIPHIKKDFKIKSLSEEVFLSVEARLLGAHSESGTVLESPAGRSVQFTCLKS